MEIREGIRYQYNHNKFARIHQSKENLNHFYAIFEDDHSRCCDYDSESWVKDFKSSDLKLVEYPYQLGDWIYCINDKFSCGSPKITQITRITHHGNTQIYINNESTYLNIIDFNACYRPCFKEEIPYEQVIKEDLKYLIPFINKLNNYG